MAVLSIVYLNSDGIVLSLVYLKQHGRQGSDRTHNSLMI